MNAVEEDNLNSALLVLGIDLEKHKLHLSTISTRKFLLHWAKFSVANEEALLARCASEDQRATVAKRLLECRTIVLASKLAGEDE